MDENGFTGMFHFLSATPPLPIIKEDVFSKWVLGFFLQRRGQNFDRLDTNFSKMLTKNEPFDFPCSKGADKNLRVHFPVIHKRAGSTVGVLTLNGTFPTHPLINLQPRHLNYILKLRKKYSLSYAGQMF